MRGYVYILTNSALPDLVKIGFSTKDPSLRVSELSNTSVPTPFVLLYEVLVEDPYALEQVIHRELKSINAHEGKEFFRISPEKAIHTVRSLIEATSRDIYFEPKTSIKCPKCNTWSLSQICEQCKLDSNKSSPDQYSIKVLDHLISVEVEGYKNLAGPDLLYANLIDAIVNAAKGDADAYLEIADFMLLDLCRDGVKLPNFVEWPLESKNWWEKAAFYMAKEAVDRGSIEARVRLSEMLSKGLGCHRDDQLACFWFWLSLVNEFPSTSRDNGCTWDPASTQRRNELWDRIGTEQLKAAALSAIEWSKKHPPRLILQEDPEDDDYFLETSKQNPEAEKVSKVARYPLSEKIAEFKRKKGL